VKAGISLFTYGKASNKEKPNQETGIKLHAASGKVSSQSQSDVTKITADKSITVSAKEFQYYAAEAGQWLWGTVQGAYNEKQSASQIITDAVIGMIPVVGDVMVTISLGI
jgi:type VI secretion system secreted protein VgrG